MDGDHSQSSAGDPSLLYEIGDIIGKGSFGEVGDLKEGGGWGLKTPA